MKTKSLLLWHGRVYTNYSSTWILRMGEKGSVVLAVNTDPCPKGKYTYSIPFICTCIGVIYVWVFEREWFRVDIAVSLLLASGSILLGWSLLYAWEVSHLKKLPRIVLRYSHDSACFLHDDLIIIPPSSRKIIHYIYDYCPLTYEDSWSNASESMYSLYYEVNLEVISGKERNFYGLVSGKSSRVCLPIAQRLAEMTCWELVTNS